MTYHLDNNYYYFSLHFIPYNFLVDFILYLPTDLTTYYTLAIYLVLNNFIGILFLL